MMEQSLGGDKSIKIWLDETTWKSPADDLRLYWYAAKSLQSCLTLCDPIDGSPPCSSIHGIFQARILEWVAIPFSNA